MSYRVKGTAVYIFFNGNYNYPGEIKYFESSANNKGWTHGRMFMYYLLQLKFTKKYVLESNLN